MKKSVLFLVMSLILAFLFVSPSFSEESTVSAENSPWLEVYRLQGNAEIDIFLLSLGQDREDSPEVWQIGMTMRERDNMTIGLSWTEDLSPSDHKGPREEGETDFRIPWGTYAALAGQETMDIPSVIRWNVFYQPKPGLTAEAGLFYNRWSRYGDNGLEDTLGLQLGLVYDLNQTMNLQAGYIFDPSPADGGGSFLGSAPYDRHILRFGTGFRRGDLDLTLSYMFLLYEKNGAQLSSSMSDPFFEEEDDDHLELKVQYRF